MTVGDFGDWHRLAQTRVGHDNMVVRLAQGQLIPHARFALTQGIDPASDRRYALADVEVESLHKGGIDGPTTCGQDLLDVQLGAAHHAVLDPYEAPAPVRFHHLSREQLGQRHPPRLRSWPLVLATRGVPPMAAMRSPCRAVILAAIG